MFPEVLTPHVSDKTFTSLEGFIGRDPVRSEIVLAIRGSESVRNWIADLTLSKTSVSNYVDATQKLERLVILRLVAELT